MELEQLRKAWEVKNKAQIIYHQVDQNQIGWMLSKKSNSTIAKIKRNMLIKIILTGLAGVFAQSISWIHLLGVVEKPLYLEETLTLIEVGVIFFVIGLIMIGISVTNMLFYRRVKEFEVSTDPLSVTLKKVSKIIESIIWLGISSDLFVTPMLTGFVAYIKLYNREAFIFDKRVFALALIFFGFGALSFFMNRWTMQKKFGKHLDKLKEYLKELELTE